MTIKLIALDLDGTTLNNEHKLSRENREALEEATDRGINVVVATGRAFSSLPEDIFKIAGIQYVITSNGAAITDLRTDEIIYENCLHSAAVEASVELLCQYDFMVEAFIKGEAFIEKAVYDQIKETRISFRYVDYVLATRKPKENIFDFILANKDQIENISVNFEDQGDRHMVWKWLEEIENTTITTAFDHNLEIGGANTSKAEALRELGGKLSVKPTEMMAIGDSPNDIEMMRLVGLPVAVSNAKEEVKAVAKVITGSNTESGVAQAVRKFAL